MARKRSPGKAALPMNDVIYEQEAAELNALINLALTLADKNNLDMVGVKLDEARLALEASIKQANKLRSDSRRSAGGNGSSPPVLVQDNVINLRPPMSFEALIAEHELLDQMRRGLMELVEGPPAPFEAQRQLLEFEEAIASHRANEVRWVYGPMLAKGIGDDPQLGLSCRELVLEAEDAWTSYLRRWNESKIAAEWTAFALQTHSVLTRAGERMRLEERIIYPLALKKGMIRLRDVG